MLLCGWPSRACRVLRFQGSKEPISHIVRFQRALDGIEMCLCSSVRAEGDTRHPRFKRRGLHPTPQREEQQRLLWLLCLSLRSCLAHSAKFRPTKPIPNGETAGQSRAEITFHSVVNGIHPSIRPSVRPPVRPPTHVHVGLAHI